MKHDMTMECPKLLIGKTDVVFRIYKNEDKFGKLKISKGSIVWMPKNAKIGKKMRWSVFDRFMRDNAKEAE